MNKKDVFVDRNVKISEKFLQICDSNASRERKIC